MISPTVNIGAKKVGGNPTFSISFEFKNPELFEQWAELEKEFSEYYYILYRNCVYETHKYLLRITPIQTGMLRAGWTGILNKYNIDYTRAFSDVMLLDIPANSGQPLSQEAITKGMALSLFVDTKDEISIMNNVPYADYVDAGTSKMQGQNFTIRAMYKGEFIFKKAMEDWLNEIYINGEVTKPKPVEEVVA